jgi:hypothetical protein
VGENPSALFNTNNLEEMFRMKVGMAQGVDPRSLKAQRAMQDDDCETLECTSGDRSLMETVGLTNERLHRIESRLFRLEAILFGSYPTDSDCAKGPQDMSVRYLALEAFSTSTRIERLVDELIYRTEAN